MVTTVSMCTILGAAWKQHASIHYVSAWLVQISASTNGSVEDPLCVPFLCLFMILLVHGMEHTQTVNSSVQDIICIMEASKAGILDESDIKTLAKKVLLPTEDAKLAKTSHDCLREPQERGTESCQD